LRPPFKRIYFAAGDALDPALGRQLGVGNDLRGPPGQCGEVDFALAPEGDRNHVTIMYLRQANHLRKRELHGLGLRRSWGGRRTG
jgi:hypothetical protein